MVFVVNRSIFFTLKQGGFFSILNFGIGGFSFVVLLFCCYLSL